MRQQNTPTLNTNNQEASTSIKIKDLLRMNPPVFIGSKIDEDLKNFIDKVWKVLKEMDATDTKGVKFSSYQLKNLDHIWCNLWEESNGEDVKSEVQDEFESSFLDHFFPKKLKEAKVGKFVNLE